MYNYQKLKIVKDDFSNYFSILGFKKINPAPLIPDNDTSILFSNSAIVPFKPYLKQDNVKLFNIQKCIRFRGGKDLFNFDEAPYMSTFDMAGAIAPAEYKDILIEDVQDFLLNTLEIPEKKLYVDVSSQDKQLAKDFSQYFEIQYDRLPPSKYDAVFGDDGVSGRCVHFSMYYNNGKTHNFGKIIRVDSDDKTTGYAFGFGLEKFLYMKDDRENYYEATTIYDLTKDIQHPIAWKYMNALSALCYLYSQCVDYNLPQYGKQKKIVKSMLYRLGVVSELLDIPPARIRKDAEHYSALELQHKTNVDLLLHDVQKSKDNNRLGNKQIKNAKTNLINLYGNKFER